MTNVLIDAFAFSARPFSVGDNAQRKDTTLGPRLMCCSRILLSCGPRIGKAAFFPRNMFRILFRFCPTFCLAQELRFSRPDFTDADLAAAISHCTVCVRHLVFRNCTVTIGEIRQCLHPTRREDETDGHFQQRERNATRLRYTLKRLSVQGGGGGAVCGQDRAVFDPVEDLLPFYIELLDPAKGMSEEFRANVFQELKDRGNVTFPGSARGRMFRKCNELGVAKIIFNMFDQKLPDRPELWEAGLEFLGLLGWTSPIEVFEDVILPGFIARSEFLLSINFTSLTYSCVFCLSYFVGRLRQHSTPTVHRGGGAHCPMWTQLVDSGLFDECIGILDQQLAQLEKHSCKLWKDENVVGLVGEVLLMFEDIHAVLFRRVSSDESRIVDPKRFNKLLQLLFGPPATEATDGNAQDHPVSRTYPACCIFSLLPCLLRFLFNININHNNDSDDGIDRGDALLLNKPINVRSKMIAHQLVKQAEIVCGTFIAVKVNPVDGAAGLSCVASCGQGGDDTLLEKMGFSNNLPQVGDEIISILESLFVRKMEAILASSAKAKKDVTTAEVAGGGDPTEDRFGIMKVFSHPLIEVQTADAYNHFSLQTSLERQTTADYSRYFALGPKKQAEYLNHKWLPFFCKTARRQEMFILNTRVAIWTLLNISPSASVATSCVFWGALGAFLVVLEAATFVAKDDDQTEDQLQSLLEREVVPALKEILFDRGLVDILADGVAKIETLKSDGSPIDVTTPVAAGLSPSEPKKNAMDNFEKTASTICTLAWKLKNL